MTTFVSRHHSDAAAQSAGSSLAPGARAALAVAACAPVALLAVACSSGDSGGTDFGAGACGISEAQPNQGHYKDGTYQEQGSYISHEGEQHFTVDMTLKDGLITDVTATPGTTQKTSLGYQNSFAKKLPDVVKGCPIEAAKIHVVGGASLTSGEFNKMMAKLRDKAKA